MFSFKVAPYRKKDGSVTNMILVTGDSVDSTKPYAQQMKNFGAKWLPNIGTWGWFGSQDEVKMKTIIDKMVKPAIEFLLSKETRGEGESPRDVIAVLDKILKELSTENTQDEELASNNVFMSQKEIKDRIYDFKAHLVGTVSSAEFKRMMEPLIKFRRAQGYQYSFKNTILIWIQDPNATMVKSKGNWEKMNRTVKENAPKIALYVPLGGKKKFNGRDEREKAKREWLAANNYQSEDELTPGDMERLRHYLDSTEGDTAFKLSYSFYDVRYTVQIDGTEDIVGSNKGIDWYNDSGNETMAVKEKIEAVLEVVKDSGVDVSTTKTLGGALGVSKSGRIEVLDNAKMNSNYLMTICHEFAHELLHQEYLKNRNTEFSTFFYGRPEGKGFVEQQAELTAWIVCKFYGYDIKEAINYAAIWGMNEKNAVHAFDTVAKVSDFIINKTNAKIIENRKMMSESKNILQEVHFSGLDIAKMVGAEDVYERGMEQLQRGEEMKPNVTNKFNEMMERINSVDKKRLQENYD